MGAASMKQLWLLVMFLVVMVLIGYGWQGDPVTAGTAGAAVTVAPARP